MTDDLFTVELVALDDLREHPQNYRTHPDDQLEHIVASIKAHGFYKNIVIARDNTVLAGHGAYLAARIVRLTHVPCRRLDLEPDDPRALAVLTGDNEIAGLAEVDDRALTELLKRIYASADNDEQALLGTGFDPRMLANLAMVTRPASEIATRDEAAEWVGMPSYDPDAVPEPIRVIVSVRTDADRVALLKLLGVENWTEKTRATWWPVKQRDDLQALRIEG
jgi:hypothetical protein